jgi:hypothetical protein
MSDEDEEWYTFLLAVHAVLGTAPFSGKDLADTIGTGHATGWDPDIQYQTRIDGASLPFDLAEKWSQVSGGYKSDAGFRKSLGRWLSYRHDRYVGPDGSKWKLRLAGRDGKRDKPLYAVEPPAGYQKP